MINLNEQLIIARNAVTNLDEAITNISKLDSELFPDKAAHVLTDGLAEARRYAANLEKRAEHFVKAYQFTAKDTRYR